MRRLLERLPPHIETVMVIDPDIRIRGRDEGSTHRSGSVHQRLPAIRRRRGLPAHHDRAGRISGAIPGLRVRAGVPRRPRESRRLQHHLRACRSTGATRWRARCDEHSLSVYAEDFENAVILLSHGERIYYDGRLVVSTEGPGTLQRWFSQRVGWYHGLHQGLHRALRRDLAHQPPLAVRRAITSSFISAGCRSRCTWSRS